MNTVKCESAEKNLTGNAGLIHIGKFIDKPDLSEILKKHISIERASNATYQVADAVIMLTLGIIAGVRHMSHMALLRTDAVIRPIFGWKDFPDDSTLGRIFKLFSHSSRNELSEVGNEVRRKVWKKRWFGRVTPDSDSSVRGVYGFQEGAAVGYNPGKHGQRSYHPLFCLIAETCGCLRNWFRTGDAYSANGIVRFAGECVARLPKGVWKIFVRADSAFSDGAFPDFLGSRGASYLIRARMGNLQTVLSGQTWRRVRNMPGYESAEFSYRCAERTKPGRFVGVRKLIGVMTEGVLFPEHIYDYFCYVTNDSLTPWQAHKKYGKRAAAKTGSDGAKIRWLPARS